MRRGKLRAGMIVLVACGAGTLALAHPHVFVDVELSIEVTEDGAVRRLRQEWTFDDMYSAFAVQGLPGPRGKPGLEALARLAEEMMEKLDAVDYFTTASAPDQDLQAIGAEDARVALEDGRLRLSFSVGLRAIKGDPQEVNLRVFDPQYVVAITLKEPVRLIGPAHCRFTIIKPGALGEDEARQLDDSRRTNQLSIDFGGKLASTVALSCVK